MSQNSFGGSAPHGETPFIDEPVKRGLDPRALKAVVAGVAAVAVLGGGAAGFLWLSSTPGGASAEAVVPRSTSVPSVTVPGSDDTTDVVFTGGGHDLFPATAAGSATSTSESGPSAAGTGSSGSTTVSSTSAGTTSGGTTPTGTTTTRSPATGSRATSTPRPSTAAPTAKPTPSPSKSTAQPWVQGQVAFDGFVDKTTTGTANFVLAFGSINPVKVPLSAGTTIPSTSTVFAPQGKETDRAMTDDEKKTCQDSYKAATTNDAAQAIYRATDNCTTVRDFVWQAVFVPSSQVNPDPAKNGAPRIGWMTDAGSKLSDAQLGKVTGTVRWIGQRDESYLIQVDDNAPVWLAKGTAVPGTPLTFDGTGLATIDRDDVAVFSANGTKYFTVLGGGETAGVTF